MKHKKCGGKFERVENTAARSAYQCNKCFAVRTVYKKIATGGSPTAGKDKE
jgi:hypothetical protein